MSDRGQSGNGQGWFVAGEPSPGPQFRTLVETVDGGVFRFDSDGRLVAVDDDLAELVCDGSDSASSDRGTECCHRSRDRLLGTPVAELAVEGDRDRVTSALGDAGNGDADTDTDTDTDTGIDLDTDTITELEITVPTDGDPVPCRLRLNRSLPEESTGTYDGGGLGVVRPIRSETAAHSSPPEPLQSMPGALEAAGVGVFVLDSSFDVAWINDTTERYFGIDRTDVVGRDKRQLIVETIRDRVSEGDAEEFVDTVLATYDDNSYLEQFECRITGGDGDERWLEHRSKPIESGPYDGGRIELYYDVTEQRRRAVQLRRLNEGVRDWLECDTREAVAERACRSLEDVLDLDINGVYRYDDDREALRPAAQSERAVELFDELPTFGESEGIVWRVFETGESEIYEDVRSDPDVYNPETPIRSEIVLPIGDHGVLLVGSERAAAFGDEELSLAKIVASSLEAIFDRIRNERRLQCERSQTEKLLRTAPVAIAVEDANGETVLTNRYATEELDLPADATIENVARSEAWTVYDVDDGGERIGEPGEPLEPERAPSALARRFGDPVVDRELVLESDDENGDDPARRRRWFSVNAAPVPGPDGELGRVVIVGEDITERKEYERRLERRKSELETELSEILGRVSDAFVAVDDDWRFTHANDHAADLLGAGEGQTGGDPDPEDDGSGADPDDLLGERLWDAYPGEVEPIRRPFREAMRTQRPVSVERRVDALDSWLEFTAYPSETGLSVYFRDVTDRKEQERELRRYETIVETIEDGIYVIDEDNRFTTVNDAYTELTGYDREALLGSHGSLVADESTIALARRLAADDADASTIETEIETAAGDRVPVEATVTSLTRADGKRERIGVVRDVTERMERQRQLEASEQRYRTLVENFPQGIVALFDDDLRYTAAGGALLDDLGAARETIIGQRLPERYDDDLVEEIEPHFRAALEGEERSFEITYCGRELSARILPVRIGDEVDAGMLVAQDVTERNEYQRRLEESNERLEQFAYAASHDLQEPLRMVSSYLQLIDRRYGDDLDEDGQEFLAYAVDGAERMKAMIEGLLEYSRVETRGDPLEPVDLNAVLEDVRDDLTVSLAEENATVEVEALPTVRGDAHQLRQVFQNLLSNAVEYSGDESPRIEVSAERTTGRTRTIAVRDEGIGIHPDDQERIFEVFQRLQAAGQGSGTGIGLALCRRIVERHDGEIDVESTPGEGTTFYVTLPAASEN